MTDSQPTSHQPPPASTHAGAHQGHSYDGFDPDLPEEHSGGHAARISTVQVGASAAAAVTSALAASFFGVAGTLIGAAVGSIVSTIAGALYADYLRRAGSRLRDTRSIVVQRLPAEALTTPLRQLSDPATQQTGTQADTHSGTHSGTHVDPGDPAAVPSQASLQPVEPDGQETVVRPPVPPEEPAPNHRPWWKRPQVLLAGIGVAGFLIAVVVVTVIELGLGHPVSGGGSGTSLSHAVEGKTSSSTSKPTPTVTLTLTPSATASPTTTATATPTVTATATPTVTATATSTPDDTATTQPTSTPQATSTAGDIVPVATGTP